MLMPDNNGMFVCKADNFETGNLFEYLDHYGVEYDWMVKLNKKHSFNLYPFLGELTNLAMKKDYEQIYELIQSAVLLLINASTDSLDEFIEETEVIVGMEDMMDQVERFLNDNESK
jgi:phosphoserine phosphatase